MGLGRRRASAYTAPMSTVFFVMTGLAMAAVLATLGAGLIGMARNDGFNARYGNRLMRLRVTLQAVAVVFFLLALLST